MDVIQPKFTLLRMSAEKLQTKKKVRWAEPLVEKIGVGSFFAEMGPKKFKIDPVIAKRAHSAVRISPAKKKRRIDLWPGMF